MGIEVQIFILLRHETQAAAWNRTSDGRHGGMSGQVQIPIILSREVPVTTLKGTREGQHRSVNPGVVRRMFRIQKDLVAAVRRLQRAGKRGPRVSRLGSEFLKLDSFVFVG